MNKIHQKNRKEDHPLVNRYVSYLGDVRGLAENSVLVYTPYVRDLLANQVAKTGVVSVRAFDASAIRDFLLDHSRGRSGEYVRLLELRNLGTNA